LVQAVLPIVQVLLDLELKTLQLQALLLRQSTSVFTNVDISGDIDVDGTTSLDVGGAVFNEAGADVDFRVESDTVDHALFVQGSDGFVGIGTSYSIVIASCSAEIHT
jgi:hypothetical protein